MNEQQQPPPNTEKLNEEIRMLFQLTAEDVDRVKQWQWTLFLQLAAAQGALLALYAAVPESFRSHLQQGIFIGISLVLFGIGAYYLRLSGGALESMRARFPKCRAHFEQQTNDILGQGDKATKIKIHWTLIAILAFATVSVCLLIALTPLVSEHGGGPQPSVQTIR